MESDLTLDELSVTRAALRMTIDAIPDDDDLPVTAWLKITALETAFLQITRAYDTRIGARDAVLDIAEAQADAREAE